MKVLQPHITPTTIRDSSPKKNSSSLSPTMKTVGKITGLLLLGGGLVALGKCFYDAVNSLSPRDQLCKDALLQSNITSDFQDTCLESVKYFLTKGESYIPLIASNLPSFINGNHDQLTLHCLQNNEVMQSLENNMNDATYYAAMALGKAANEGEADTVNFLVNSPYIAPEEKYQAFYSATESGHLNLVEILAEDSNILDACREEALQLSVKAGHINIYNYLTVQYGSNLSEALDLAAEKGELNTVKFLVDRWLSSPENNRQGIKVDSALYKGVEGRHLDVIQLLLQKRDLISDDCYTNGYTTALKRAAEIGNLKVIEVLIQNNSFSSKSNKETVLSIAVQESHDDVVKYFLNDSDISNWNKLKILKDAAANGNIDIFQAALNGSHNLGGILGEALTLTASNGHQDIAQIILDKQTLNHVGYATAIHQAREAGQDNIAKLIVNKLSTLFTDSDRDSDVSFYVLKHVNKNGWTDTVKFILKHLQMSDNFRSRLLELAEVWYFTTLTSLLT